jgi:NAD(P)H dehydrogenase (quinone)
MVRGTRTKMNTDIQVDHRIYQSNQIKEVQVRRGSARNVMDGLMHVGEALGIHNLDPEPGNIFVTGGTGIIGHRVAARLLNAGYPHVRLGTSKVDSLGDMNKLGAEIADFSWDREQTYAKALTGIKSVLCTMPYEQHWYKHFPAFLEACKKAHVKHLVKLSFYHARIPGDVFSQVPLVKHHADCDEMLISMVKPVVINSGEAVDFYHPNRSYTIIYASHFMSNPFTYQGTELRHSETRGALYGSSMNHAVNYVSPNDVAEAAVRILLEPRAHYDKEYTLTGPGPITDLEIANLLSGYFKKPIEYVDQPLDEFSAKIKQGGDPRWLVADLVALEKIKASGREEDHKFVSDDFEKICGHSPESFEDYLTMTDTMIPVEVGAPSELKPLRFVTFLTVCHPIMLNK